MAKVRLQARPAEAKEEEGLPTVNSTSESKSQAAAYKPRYTGAMDVLRKTLKEQGFVGWYQVSTLLAVAPTRKSNNLNSL